PAVLLIAAAFVFGLTPVFMMRANGLFAYYFMDRLDLETMAPEVTYVPTAKNLDEIESRKGLTWKPIVLSLILGGALSISLGGTVGMNSSGGFMVGAMAGLTLVGLAISGIGFLWVMFEAFMDSMMWFGAIQLGWPVSFTVRLLTFMEYS